MAIEKVNQTWKCISKNAIYTYISPNSASDKISTLANGDVVVVLAKDGNYLKMEDETWVCKYDKSKNTVMQLVKDNTSTRANDIDTMVYTAVNNASREIGIPTDTILTMDVLNKIQISVTQSINDVKDKIPMTSELDDKMRIKIAAAITKSIKTMTAANNAGINHMDKNMLLSAVKDATKTAIHECINESPTLIDKVQEALGGFDFTNIAVQAADVTEGIKECVINVINDATAGLSLASNEVQNIYNAVILKVQDVVDDTVKTTEDIIQKVTPYVKDAISNTLSTCESIGNNIKDAANTAIEQAEIVYQSVISSDTFINIQNSIQTALETAGTVTSDALVQAQRIVEQAKTNIMDMAQEAGININNMVVNELQPFVQNAIKTAAEHFDIAVDTVMTSDVVAAINNGVANAKVIATNIINNIKSSVSSIMNQSANIIEDIKSGALLTSVQNTIGNIFQNAQIAINSISITDIKNSISNGISTASSTIENIITDISSGKVLNDIQGFVKKGIEKASFIASNIKTSVEEMIKKSGDIITDVKNSEFVQKVQTIVDKVLAQSKLTFDTVVNSQIVADISAGLNTAVDSIKDGIDYVLSGKAFNDVKDLFEAAVDKANTVIDSIKKFVKDAIESIKDAIDTIAKSDFVAKVGEAIQAGINAVSDVIDAILANKWVAAAVDAFGKFIDWVGDAFTTIGSAIGSAFGDDDKETKTAEKELPLFNTSKVTFAEYNTMAQNYMNDIASTLCVENFRAVHGVPYQFLPSVDPRLSDSESAFGRKFAEKIVAKMPMLLMTPGNPVFMPNLSQKKRKEALKTILLNWGGDASATNTDLTDLLGGKQSSLYSIEMDYIEYFKYVNPMCRTGAMFLDLGDEVLDGVPLSQYGWGQNTNEEVNSGFNIGETIKGLFATPVTTIKNLQKSIYYRSCVPFYIESETQITEQFTNSTSTPSSASTVNSLSQSASELQFIAGSATKDLDIKYDEVVETLTDELNNLTNFVDNALDNGGIFSNLADKVKTIAVGGRLIFPEIWSDFQFSRSYSVKIKLTTPDCDKLSWYLNIYVPLVHLLAFVLPKQAPTPDGYRSPFILRAFYKGLFNINMGIITDMSVTKGKEGGWTKEGLPTSIDVDFTIKDLYSSMSMSNNDDIVNGIMNNTCQMDYIANSCGININVPDNQRKVEMWFKLNVNSRFMDWWNVDIFGNIEKGVNNLVMGILGGY